MVVGCSWLSTPLAGVPTAAVQVFWATRRFAPQGDLVADNRSLCHGLLLATRGSLVVRSEGSTWQVPEGSAFVRVPSVPHDFEFAPGGEYLSVGLRATLFYSVDLLACVAAPRVWQPQPAEARLLEGCLGELVQSVGQVDPAARLVTTGLAQTVVGLVCRALTPTDTASRLFNTPTWLNAVLLAAEEDPGINVAQLAQVAAYSEGQLRRLFHAHLGISPHAYLQARRLDAARQLLEATNLPVGSIAERLGFASAPHFTRLFKTSFGLAPRDYRRQSSAPPV